MKLTTYLKVVLRLRITGTVPLLPQGQTSLYLTLQLVTQIIGSNEGMIGDNVLQKV